MKLRSALLAGAAMALATMTGATAAQAAVVTFDDAAGNSILDAQFGSGGSFDDQGLTFTSHGSYMYVWDSSSPNSNGTNNNIFAGWSGGDTETITKTGGGNFNLNSLDLAISWYDGNPTDTITINGTPLTISQTLTTYNLNLHNVSSVTISGVASNGGYWLADNISYTACVPEPGIWAMTLLGFGALGMALRSRRQAMIAA